MLGAGLAHAGISLGGYGELTNIKPSNNKEWVIPGTNISGNGRYIDPETKDYKFNNNGLFVGQTAAQQQVYLALSTIQGSAAQSNLGNSLYRVRTIADNYKEQITALVNQCLADLVNSKTIILNSVIVNRNKINSVYTIITWTDPLDNKIYTAKI